ADEVSRILLSSAAQRKRGEKVTVAFPSSLPTFSTIAVDRFGLRS
ncbi:hypothetical protein CEXT_527141, partial [Caerostris extrusa]